MNVDQAARDIANQALAEIRKHEAQCAERVLAAQAWRTETSTKLSGISKSISGLYGRLWMAASGLVGVLLAIIGWLITHPQAGL